MQEGCGLVYQSRIRVVAFHGRLESEFQSAVDSSNIHDARFTPESPNHFIMDQNNVS